MPGGQGRQFFSFKAARNFEQRATGAEGVAAVGPSLEAAFHAQIPVRAHGTILPDAAAPYFPDGVYDLGSSGES